MTKDKRIKVLEDKIMLLEAQLRKVKGLGAEIARTGEE